MTKFLPYLFVLVFSIEGYGQARLTQNVLLLNLPQGHTIEDLSGHGNFGATQSSLSNINAGNPASISDFSGFNLGISYQMNSTITEAWIAGIGYKRNHIYFPQSFSLSYGMNNFTFGLASNQIYNGTLDYGEIKGTLVADNEQGYIEIGIFHPLREDIVIKNSFLLNYNFKNLFVFPGNLDIGFQYNYNFLKSSFIVKTNKNTSEYEKYIPQEWDETIFVSNYAIGIRYGLSPAYLKYLLFGIYYESPLEFEKRRSVDGNSNRLYGYIPSKIHAGTSIGFHNNLILSANLTYYLWELIKSNTHALNQIRVNGNASYLFNENFTPAIGFIITDRKYDLSDDIFGINNSLFVTFITAGFVYKYDRYEFDFSFADSHLFSDDWRKESIVKIGIGYKLN